MASSRLIGFGGLFIFLRIIVYAFECLLIFLKIIVYAFEGF